MSLVDDAKKIHSSSKNCPHTYTDEDFELVIAWFKGEVTLNQILVVKGGKPNRPNYSYLARCSREMFRRGRIKECDNEKISKDTKQR